MLINKIILGTVQLGLNYGINNAEGKPGKEKVLEILACAQQAGIDCVDTAQSYGDAIEIIGEFNKFNHPFGVINKFSDTGLNDLTKKIERSLQILNIKSFEACLYHSFSEFKKDQALKDQLLFLKHKGMIKKIGVSVYGNEEFQSCINSDFIDIIQFPFNLLDNFSQRGKLMAEACKRKIELHARSVYLQGLFFIDIEKLPMKFLPLKEPLLKLHGICKKFNTNINSIALNYVLSNSLVDKVIIGVDNPGQLKYNLSLINPDFNPKISKLVDEVVVKNEGLLNPVNWGKP